MSVLSHERSKTPDYIEVQSSFETFISHRLPLASSSFCLFFFFFFFFSIRVVSRFWFIYGPDNVFAERSFLNKTPIKASVSGWSTFPRVFRPKTIPPTTYCRILNTPVIRPLSTVLAIRLSFVFSPLNSERKFWIRFAVIEPGTDGRSRKRQLNKIRCSHPIYINRLVQSRMYVSVFWWRSSPWKPIWR